MARVSISEAARLAGVARSHLYAKFIKPGKITVERDSRGNKVIDTAELLRVFGVLTMAGEDRTADSDREQLRTPPEDNKDNADSNASVPVLKERIRGLEALLKVKEEALETVQVQVERLLGIVENQTKLLEHKHPPTRSGSTRLMVLVVLLIAAVIALVVYRQGWSV